MTTLNPTLTITLPRTFLPGSLDPLLFSASDDENDLGIIDFVRPPQTPRVVSITSDHQHGDNPLRWSYQHAILAWTVSARVATEAAAQAYFKEIQAAITQALKFPVTTKEDDAPAEVWTCNPGAVVPAARSLQNMQHHDTLWTVSLPCYPIPA